MKRLLITVAFVAITCTGCARYQQDQSRVVSDAPKTISMWSAVLPTDKHGDGRATLVYSVTFVESLSIVRYPLDLRHLQSTGWRVVGIIGCDGPPGVLFDRYDHVGHQVTLRHVPQGRAVRMQFIVERVQ